MPEAVLDHQVPAVFLRIAGEAVDALGAHRTDHGKNVPVFHDAYSTKSRPEWQMQFGCDFNAKFMTLYLRGCALQNASSYERHMKYLKTLKISVPPLKEQERVVAKVEKFEKEISAAEQKLAASVSAKAAILDKYLK